MMDDDDDHLCIREIMKKGEMMSMTVNEMIN